MSAQTLREILALAREDGHYFQLLQADPTTALAGYDLTPDERYALEQRDRGLLVQLGVPADWADWFGIQH